MAKQTSDDRNSGSRICSAAGTLEVVFHRDDGTDEVRHRVDVGSFSAVELQAQVKRLQRRAIAGGYHCPYTWRIV